MHALVGSWIIAGKAAGIGMREDRALVTSNMSRFVPHYFTNP
jgi:glutathionylspermidine synthase